MNKSNLIAVFSEKANLSKRNAEQFVNIMIDSMIKALKNGERVEIRGFGSFVVRTYGAYEGRNPKTGETINVDQKKLPFFKAGKDLLSRIND
ncbi:integration host factor subunit beta [bacterium]|jgi:integration host factor subunit beta|nr:integration host factor subunit beta [bacterium]MBR4532711.1 integration host factor subunit beta [bacterium]